jgi:ribosomal protein L11 methyltransferase
MCNCVSLAPFKKLIAPPFPGVADRLADSPTLGIEERADRIEAWYPADLDLGGLVDEVNGRIEVVAEEPWDELWKSRIRPIRVGAILVLAPWLPEEAGENSTVVRIDPGMGFGTGEHATTRACLALLQRNLRSGASVLDYGCGSGILAIAAILLGASRAVGIDCEEAAIENARENAALNGVAVDLRLGDEPPASERFDLVVSNIQSSILRPRLDRLRAALVPGGTLILSGLLDEDRFEEAITPSAVIADGPWRTYEIVKA